jgi:hypothetical protein
MALDAMVLCRRTGGLHRTGEATGVGGVVVMGAATVESNPGGRRKQWMGRSVGGSRFLNGAKGSGQETRH